MSQPGVHNMGVGAAIAAVGGIITVGSIAVTGGAFGVIAYGAIIVGGAQFCIGIGQFLIFHSKTGDAKALHYAQIEVRALVRSMIATAMANSVLDAAEKKMIATLYERFIGASIATSLIDEIASGMEKDKSYSISEDLKTTQSQISHGMKIAIIKCCYLVSIADGSVDAVELERLGELGGVLRLSQNDFDMAIRDVQAAFAPASSSSRQASA